MTNELLFAESDEVAEIRYNRHKNIDPFPKIDPALLNAADILDYVRKTGMIFPFNPENIKSASYEMNLGGEYLFWNEHGHEENGELIPNAEITLRKNSITFVTVDAVFRLPDYIAMRFNLQIEHVHKGILLGTGPLINPGFCGKLMIPIHNLTSNDYKFKAGSSLIGVEFTKLSSNKSWQNFNTDQYERIGTYKKNLGKKNNKKFQDFIDKHVPRGNIVKSSLSGTIDKADKSAKEASELIDKIKNYSLIGAITVVFALFALAYQVYDIVSSANSFVSSSSQRLMQLEKDNATMKKNLENINKKLNIDNQAK